MAGVNFHVLKGLERLLFDVAFGEKLSLLFALRRLDLAALEDAIFGEDAFRQKISPQAQPAGFPRQFESTAGDPPRRFKTLLQRLACAASICAAHASETRPTASCRSSPVLASLTRESPLE